jgi:hypothetical protein
MHLWEKQRIEILPGDLPQLSNRVSYETIIIRLVLVSSKQKLFSFDFPAFSSEELNDRIRADISPIDMSYSQEWLRRPEN